MTVCLFDFYIIVDFDIKVLKVHQKIEKQFKFTQKTNCKKTPANSQKTSYFIKNVAISRKKSNIRFFLQFMKTAEYYVTASSEIDLSKCTFIPEAPRVDKKEKGHSEAANDRAKSPNKLGKFIILTKKKSTWVPTPYGALVVLIIY